jgi:hypothetical protein
LTGISKALKHETPGYANEAEPILPLTNEEEHALHKYGSPSKIWAVRFNEVASWIKKWWAYMTGALSVPFTLLSVLNVASQRVAFAILAYLALGILVAAQERRIRNLQNERANEVDDCLNSACRLLQEPEPYLSSFNAICGARAYELGTNDQVASVCDQLAQYGHTHPFDGLENYVPRRDWLEFVRTAWRRPDIRVDQKNQDYVGLAREWPAIKGYPQPQGRIPSVRI